MEKQKPVFEDFLITVDSEHKDFVNELHRDLIENGCQTEIKAAKSGYVVSYILDKKTAANYVFRKKGLIIRIYANQVNRYMDFLNTLPDQMLKSIEAASICKRLVNPDSCNSKCAMGYDFLLKGERLQKCRSNAFMFLICEENNPFIRIFLENEIKGRESAIACE